ETISFKLIMRKLELCANFVEYLKEDDWMVQSYVHIYKMRNEKENISKDLKEFYKNFNRYFPEISSLQFCKDFNSFLEMYEFGNEEFLKKVEKDLEDLLLKTFNENKGKILQIFGEVFKNVPQKDYWIPVFWSLIYKWSEKMEKKEIL